MLQKILPNKKFAVKQNAASPAPVDLYSFLFQPNTFRTIPCVVGIFLGLFCCALAGSLTAKRNFYLDFHRFHEFLSPTTYFYPTVSQMVAIAEAGSTNKQTLVIVGGNSIFNGIGQRVEELWTDQLRSDLGDNYAVFNFASPGSLPFEGAYWAAETLHKRGRKVLFTTVAIPTQAGNPDGEQTYGYLYWDAHEKAMLLNYKLRDDRIATRLAMADEKEKTRVMELKLSMQLDSLLHFQDLWSAVGYSNFFTVWTQPTARSPFRPRYRYSDIQPYPLPVSKRFGNDKELSQVRGFCDGYFEITPKFWKINPIAWKQLLYEMDALTPPEFRKNCLIVLAGNPPYYLDRLTEPERSRITKATELSVQSWQRSGYHAEAVGTQFLDEDYRDCWHLVGPGGKKMAELVARQIQQMNREVGYQK